MEWLYSLFLEHSALQAVVVLSLISAVGLGLGRVHFWGVSLGVTFVFFTGILAGHLGLSVDPQMLNYAESFGLVIFVYSLGLQVGPGFFSSFRKGGVTLNMLALGVVLLGTLLTVVASYATGVSLPDMVGILCGATTNTPALGAAQQTLKQMGLESSTPALGCAVAYPMGVVGVILAVLLIRKALVRKEDLEIKEKDDANKTYIAAFQVHNPAIFNKSIKDIAHMSYPKFVISRLWRDGHVSIPTSDKVLKEGDRLLVITAEKDALALTVLFGEQENTDWNKEDIDWNAIDSELVSQRIVVTRPELNGKKLGSLRLRNHYGINISRVYRSGVQLLATPELILQLGDRLTVVGEKAAILNVEKVLGNAIKSLKEPNLVVIFIGIVLGLALGAIPFSIPGVSTPVKLGLAGGPIIVGILLGTFGPRIHMITYTTRSANLMLRALGLSLYLACLGLDAGAHFFDIQDAQRIVVTRPELNGKKLGSLRLRNHYGINISRVYRSGVQLLATPELILQLGDRLTVVGEKAAILNVEKVLGNAIKSLKEPNLVVIFIGIVLGLALGAIPFSIPGVSTPVKLGLAGGPIIVGILLGTFGPRIHMITYTTRSANLMLRALGLSLYLACLGLDAGAHFFDTVFRPEGLLWIALGAGLTIIPTVLVGFVAFKMMKIDFGTVSGMLCGSMANPMALNYANDTIPGDNPSVAYATVYPLCMFLRVIIAQVLLMFFLG